MPPTILHYCTAYVFHRLGILRGHNLVFPAVIKGSFIPDIEIPFLVILGVLRGSRFTGDRLVLHSILGGATLGVIITSLLIVYVYPKIFRKAGFETGEFKFSVNLIVSSLIGVISHVFIDSLHHPYNPLLYPFTIETVNSLVLFGDYEKADWLVIYPIFYIFFLLIVIYELKKGRKGFWGRILINLM